jgi:magnesium transporter
MNGKSYLKILGLQQLFGTQRTKEILSANPTVLPVREEAKEIRVFVYDYDTDEIGQFESDKVQDCFDYKFSNKLSWINVDGLRKADVEAVAQHFEIHSLLVEDILSVNQRPKMDEVEGRMLCVLNMLYFNENKRMVETEQISIILGDNFVISFQEDASRDVFNPLRLKLNMPKSQLRSRPADYLCYTMIDLIVDNYFIVMEKLGEQIESLEEELIRKSNNRSLIRINQLRKEHIVLKRNIGPVRDMLNSIIRSESDLLEDKTTKYFNDVYDHISQAFDLSENYRDMLMSMQDLHINNVNLKLNEVMKVMAIVTCLLAPATVIGGIFGMNFDIIPYAHHQWGFYFAVMLMLVIPIWMLFIFRRRGWF